MRRRSSYERTGTARLDRRSWMTIHRRSICSGHLRCAIDALLLGVCRYQLRFVTQLLRLKCEAYSTLNESDEDATAVARLQEKMTQLGGTTPPVPALVAPASLYLTAILECVPYILFEPVS